MTYLGFLNLLKPFFNHQLARDLLLRDTYAKKGSQQQVQYQIQQTVLVLLNQLLFLNCVLIAEHQVLKQALIQEYMLNNQQLIKILGLQSKLGTLKAIYEFITCSSQYEIQQNEIKYLLSFLQTSQYTIINQKYINILFLPSKLKTIKSKKQIKIKEVSNIKQIKQKQQLHSNYNKQFISKNDIISSKKSFLNYIHPNSFKHIPQQRNQETKKQYNKPIKSLDSDRISIQEHQIPNHSSKLTKEFIKAPHNHISLKLIKEDSYELDQSIIQNSNVYKSKLPDHYHHKSKKQIYLQQSKVHNFQTPILEQFMHPNNLKLNLGHYKGSSQANQLNNIIQQSRGESLTQSDAIQRVQTYQNPPIIMKNIKPIKPNNSLNIQNSKNNQNFPYQGAYERFQDQKSSYYKSNNNSNLNNKNNNVANSRKMINISSQSGILGQFYKQQYK